MQWTWAAASLAVELNTRDGLPNFFAKISRAEEVRVAFLGGSITAGLWRERTMLLLLEASSAK